MVSAPRLPLLLQGCSTVRAYASRGDLQDSYEVGSRFCLTGPSLATCKREE